MTGSRVEAPVQFVVTAGPGPDGGPGGVFATYGDESAAKAAFVRERLGTISPDAWGRLVTVDASGRARVLCWFGPARYATSTAPATREGAGAPPRRRRATALLAAAVGAVGAAWRTANGDRPSADGSAAAA